MDITFLPGFWQCRQQVNFSSMTLQQHFSDAGCCPKIPIDLKRWMGVEKVRQGGLLQQLDQIIVCFFSIIETGKEIDNPSPAPPRMPSTVRQAIVYCFSCRIH